jgi:hypothetical protein
MIMWNGVFGRKKSCSIGLVMLNPIMACVSLISYKVWFNSNETSFFTCTRGIHHGEPLSPYLFLLCLEGLSAMLNHDENNESLKGVWVCRAAPMISDLIFVNDSLMSQRTSWETPRGRYDEHSSKFSLSMKPKFSRPVGERNQFRRLLLADFGKAPENSLMRG